ncbi:MAG: hypothetical protein DI582_11065 [Azospirillum brasilense]|nr:MAG: hypothetical protein DI582_11065 [Azospirillum brasilense]
MKCKPAQQKFADRMESIRHSLARLSAASERHFGTAIDNANWGDVTLAADIDSKLKELCDTIFHEGEFAN